MSDRRGHGDLLSSYLEYHVRTVFERGLKAILFALPQQR